VTTFNLLPTDPELLDQMVASGHLGSILMPQVITTVGTAVERDRMDIKESGRLNLEIINANGFEPPTWDNFTKKLILTYTEVTEAEAAVIGTGQDPLGEELADIAIRVTGMLWGLWGADWTLREGRQPAPNFPFEPIERVLRPIRDYLTAAVEAWRKDRKDDVRIALELVIKETTSTSIACGVNLLAEMERKREKNAARPPRHGNKRADG